MQTREKWLLGILTGIFIVQAGVFVYGFRACMSITPSENISSVCPELGRRYDNTFGAMIATTLALLTGSTLAANKTTKPRTTTPKSND